ncbi:MAG: rRNA adenine N-6-methyltransferase family protein, partial [Myxococcota bacterium]
MRAASIRALLGRYELHLSRDRGQHFLLDNAQAARLAGLAGVEAGDTIIEIGTGLGALTRALAERAARVVTIEV